METLLNEKIQMKLLKEINLAQSNRFYPLEVDPKKADTVNKAMIQKQFKVNVPMRCSIFGIFLKLWMRIL